IKKVVECKRIGMAVIGLEVPHAHVHLIPLDREMDILFTNPRVVLSDDEQRRLAKAIGEQVRL
ncbi:MAG: HIT family protein, partial [Bacteroidales bacterium]|nr:HIT family protein [Bacteroidales bacterium]